MMYHAAKVHSKVTLRALASVRNIHIEQRIQDLGYTLPPLPEPKGNYVPCVKVPMEKMSLLYTAGHLPQPAPELGPLIVGKVGQDLSLDEGYAAAEVVALNLLSTLKYQLGDLDRIERIVKLVGFVNCVDGFTAQPKVMDGASDILCRILGPEKGVHARSAVGVNALPLNVPVEIEAIVQVSK